MNKKITKKDTIFIIIILMLALVFVLFNRYSSQVEKREIVIRVDGEIESTCSLDQDGEISINDGTNILKISDRKAKMIHADCPDHICIQQGEISQNGESIICLPNRVVVEIREESDKTFDVISK